MRGKYYSMTAELCHEMLLMKLMGPVQHHATLWWERMCIEKAL